MKNLCSFCGKQSGTNVPFPQKKVNSGTWLSVVCPRCYSMERLKLLESQRQDPMEFKETLIAQNQFDRKRKMVGNGIIDLVFWFNDDDTIYGFQCSIRANDFDEVVFTWSTERGSNFRRLFTDRRVYQTNTLQKDDTPFPKEQFLELFNTASTNLKVEYRDLVLEKIQETI